MKVNVYDWAKRITKCQSRYRDMSEEHAEIARELDDLHTVEYGKTYFAKIIKVKGKHGVFMYVGFDETGKIFAEIPHPPKTGMTADQFLEAIKYYQKFLDVMAEHRLLKL